MRSSAGRFVAGELKCRHARMCADVGEIPRTFWLANIISSTPPAAEQHKLHPVARQVAASSDRPVRRIEMCIPLSLCLAPDYSGIRPVPSSKQPDKASYPGMQLFLFWGARRMTEMGSFRCAFAILSGIRAIHS